MLQIYAFGERSRALRRTTSSLKELRRKVPARQRKGLNSKPGDRKESISLLIGLPTAQRDLGLFCQISAQMI